ncbi:MAG TPA: asparagine synthase-related protein [Pyrinomonadaceae bacterium]|nr:asparagine synthase-related protein [Pyrinomonadaceae bacterium]
MSGIGTIFNLDGAPVDVDQLRLLSDGLSSRGPDGNSSYCSRNVGMCFSALHTTRESWFEKQPLQTPHGDVLILDGILFNRDELIDSLHIARDEDRSDAGIVSAGLQKHGAGFVSKLVGEFAIIHYDRRSDSLLLARDPFGLRPLFYHRSAGQLFVASDATAFLKLLQQSPELDHAYLCSYLVSIPEAERTPFRNIHPVPPGHLIVISEKQLTSSRFWHPESVKEIAYKHDAEYEEHCRNLMLEGVCACLRTDDRPVWASLSGGLDSSTIVCLATQLIEKEQAEAKELQTYSVVFDESSTADERQFIRAVEQQRGKAGFHLSDDRYWLAIPSPADSFPAAPTPLLCVPGRLDRLRDEMVQQGARVLLNGLGGDHVFWNMPIPSPQLANLLVNLNLIDLHRGVRVWSRVFKRPYLHTLWKMAVLPFLPDAVKAQFQPKLLLPEWVDHTFARKTRLRERTLPPPDAFGFDDPGKRIQAGVFQQLIRYLASGAHSERDGIEMRSPLLYLPLVEFSLAIPFEQKLRPGEVRSLMRRALRHDLPAKVLNRPGKGEISEAMHKGLLRHGSSLDSLLADPLLCSLGYVDRKRLQSAVTRAKHGAKVNVGALLKTISLEIWLQSFQHHGGILKASSYTQQKSLIPMASRPANATS